MKKNSFKQNFEDFRYKELRIKKIVGFFLHRLRHPLRTFYLFFCIKKCRIGYGSYRMDTSFLKFGKINIEVHKKPKVSIVIPVYNQLDYTYKCIKSICDNNKDVTFEIIIGDDLSTDGTMYIDKYIKNIKLVRNKENLRFLRNCNNAAKYAIGEYIVFLNNDTVVKENWLSSMLELLENDKNIGMVGSKLIYPNNMLQEAGGIVFSDGSCDNFGKLDDPAKAQYNYVRDVGYISGASIMLSMKLWKDIGGFDKKFIPAYCEDSDLAFEVRKRGLRVVYQPKSVVIHFEGISNGVDVSDTSSVKHYQVLNLKKLKEKWKEELKDMPSKYTGSMNIRYRDTINKKPVVVVVDHYVPEYDKDAGSKTTFQYLKMFVKKGYIVKFIPDNYYNSEPYTSTLEKMGIEVLYGLDYRKNIFSWIYENRNNIDCIYLNRPQIAAKYIDYIKKYTNIKVIYYGHDLHFLREKREYELNGDIKHLELSKEFKKKEFAVMEKADVVYYPSFVEKNLINSINPNINVKAINAYIFDDVDTNKKIKFNDKKGIMFIGGFVHKPNVDAVLWFANEIYPKIYEQLNIPFYIVGSNPSKEVLALDSIPGITVKGYVTEEELNEIYNQCKMSIIPLRYGAGIKGKVVESMSKGIPFVTTSCGAEGIVGIEKIIPIVDDVKKFAESVISLYNDNERLEKISLAERKYIYDNFSTDAAYKIIEEDFNLKLRDAIIICPDGHGCKGDESLIRGAIELLKNKKIKLVNPTRDYWKDSLSIDGVDILEEHYDLEFISECVKKEKIMFIIGNELFNKNNANSTLAKLEVASKIVKNGGICHVFSYFNEKANKNLINYIKKIDSRVVFHFMDEKSCDSFKKQTGKECDYCPNLSYLVLDNNRIDHIRTFEIIKQLQEYKTNYNLIGLNFSEKVFRSIYSKHNDENRKEYVTSLIDQVIDSIKNPYFVLLSYNLRNKNKYPNDEYYINIANDVLKEKGINSFVNIDYSLSHIDYIQIIKELDNIIIGHSQFSITAFKTNIVPIMYIGDDDIEEKNIIEKMLDDKLGDTSFVINDLKNLNKAIKSSKNNVKKIDNKNITKEFDDIKNSLL